MNAWENAVVTSLGASLLTKLVEGHTLQLTRAETGTGYVTPGTLTSEVAVSEPKQELTFKPITYPEEGKCKLPCRLTNDTVTTGYTANQIGIYAMDPDVGEILFFIAQASSGDGTIIPSSTEMPGYSAEWTFYFQYGQADGVAVSVDPANSVTREELDKVDAKIGNLSELETTEKSSLVAALNQTKLECDTRLSETNRENQYQNARLDGLDDALAGKADNEHGHAADDISGLATVATSGMYTDLIGAPVVEETYDSESLNPQSGKAVAQAIAAFVDSAPETLDTLNELAEALGDDPNFAATMAEELGKKAEKGHTHTAEEVSETDELKYNRIIQIETINGIAYTGIASGITDLYDGLEIIVISERASTSRSPSLNINNLGAKGIQQKDPVTYKAVNPYEGVIGPKPTKLRYEGGQWIAVDYNFPPYSYGTEDKEAGTSPLATGALYFVYE